MVNTMAGLGKCFQAVVSGSVKVLAFAISPDKAGWTLTGRLPPCSTGCCMFTSVSWRHSLAVEGTGVKFTPCSFCRAGALITVPLRER